MGSRLRKGAEPIIAGPAPAGTVAQTTCLRRLIGRTALVRNRPATGREGDKGRPVSKGRPASVGPRRSRQQVVAIGAAGKIPAPRLIEDLLADRLLFMGSVGVTTRAWIGNCP
ncbi:hypothetical protein GCM10009544_02270 [Streptomyces stramineus]|uniref:Uncharacterized protein n=1 Tax=Streptomyces stramineus TaxID=173861 RepID=A0ABN0ZCK8_9ACTN